MPNNGATAHPHIAAEKRSKGVGRSWHEKVFADERADLARRDTTLVVPADHPTGNRRGL
jgi:hypothetical protein